MSGPSSEVTTASRNRIGVGVITYNRPGLFSTCIRSISGVDILIVVNDGTPYETPLYPPNVQSVIQHSRRMRVARSKNDALKALLDAGCRHIFLCEDDIAFKEPGVFQRYVRSAQASGIHHLNFGFHGPRNRTPDGLPALRHTRTYPNGESLQFVRHLVGACSYYRDDVLHACGLMDESFGNALDHVEHTYRIIQKGFHPPFWWFADIAESWNYIEDLDPQLRHSTMAYDHWRSRLRFNVNAVRFALRHGSFAHRLNDVDESQCSSILNAFEASATQ